MATKQSGCLGTILSAAFTSLVAPLLVGLALHDLNAGDARERPAWVGSSRAEAGESPAALPRRGRSAPQSVYPGVPSPAEPPPPAAQPVSSPPPATPQRVNWTQPVPLEP